MGPVKFMNEHQGVYVQVKVNVKVSGNIYTYFVVLDFSGDLFHYCDQILSQIQICKYYS